MGVIPALIFLAAIGLAKIKQGSTSINYRGQVGMGVQGRYLYAFSLVLLAGLVTLHLLSAILASPYYLTYYNPLLGGPRWAAAQVPAGWGEGLEQAAHYLNNLPNSSSLTVSSWYGDIFQPYFAGRRASFADDGRAQLAADYVVFYINQMQRQKPYPGLINYFRAGEPVFVVNIGPLGQASAGGTPWVEVYRAPAAQSAGGAPKIEGVAQLLAYKVAGSRVTSSKVADDSSQLSGNELLATLFLRVLGPIPEHTLFTVALTPSQNPEPKAPSGKSESQNLVWGVWQPAQMKGDWVEGAVVEWPGTLSLPGNLPEGEYRLAVALQAADGSTIAEFAMSEKDPPFEVTASK
jgi:hypothetical protein